MSSLHNEHTVDPEDINVLNSALQDQSHVPKDALPMADADLVDPVHHNVNQEVTLEQPPQVAPQDESETPHPGGFEDHNVMSLDHIGHSGPEDTHMQPQSDAIVAADVSPKDPVMDLDLKSPHSPPKDSCFTGEAMHIEVTPAQAVLAALGPATPIVAPSPSIASPPPGPVLMPMVDVKPPIEEKVQENKIAHAPIAVPKPQEVPRMEMKLEVHNNDPRMAIKLVVQNNDPKPANPGVSHQLTSHDVVLDDTSGLIKANKLLTDLIAVHHQLNIKEEGLAKHLVDVMQNGISLAAPGQHPNFGGSFVRRGTDGSIHVIPDEEAIDYVQKCIDYEFTKALPKAEGENAHFSFGESPAKQHDLFTPGVHDLKLMHRDLSTTQPALAQEFAKSKGNQRFYMLIDQQVTNDAPTFTGARVKCALTALKRFTDSSTRPGIYIQSERTWTKASQAQAGEYAVCCVAERIQEVAPLASTAAAPAAQIPMTGTMLQALIPDVGTAEISNFMDFSKPSTTPVDEPTEYDVLFGRGGMTNNHPGNRRFRDIISLHRPDYVRAIKIEKPNVARRIVAAIRGGTPPGRFLKRNPKDLKWYDVGNRHATEKTSQALREKSQAEKKFPRDSDVKKRLLDQAIYEARVTRARLSKETKPISNGALDPNTFQLVIPPQYMNMTVPTSGYSVPVPATVVAAAATVAANGAPMKVERKVPTKFEDAKDKKMDNVVKAGEAVDANKQTEGSTDNAGVVDSEGNILVTENDILCGRGGLTNHHKGNKRFRDIVALHRPDYVRAPKVHKPAVARMIVRAIRNSEPPGRFLKKDDLTGKWFDIGDKRAAEKASQALREKTPEERNRLRNELAQATMAISTPLYASGHTGPIPPAAVAAAVAAAKASAAAAVANEEMKLKAAEAKAMEEQKEMTPPTATTTTTTTMPPPLPPPPATTTTMPPPPATTENNAMAMVAPVVGNGDQNGHGNGVIHQNSNDEEAKLQTENGVPVDALPKEATIQDTTETMKEEERSGEVVKMEVDDSLDAALGEVVKEEVSASGEASLAVGI